MVKRFAKQFFRQRALARAFCRPPRRSPKRCWRWSTSPSSSTASRKPSQPGCDQIIIVTGRGKTAIEDHFDVSYELEKMLEDRGKTDLLEIVQPDLRHGPLAYVRQKEALGLGHAVLMAAELVGDEPFAVILPDDVIDATVPCLKQMIDVFEKRRCSIIATQVVEGRAISAYGVLDAKPVPSEHDGRLFEVPGMVEKPKFEEAPSNIAIIGRYILTPTIFECSTASSPARRRTAADRRHQGLLKKEKVYGYTLKAHVTMPATNLAC